MRRPVWHYIFWPWTLALIVILGLSIRLYQTTRPPNFVLMHNVWVVQRTSPQSFHALAYSVGTNSWTEFVVTSCPDWQPTKEIQTGVTLLMLQFIEDRDHNCDELDGRYAGYTLERDAHDTPIHRGDPRASIPDVGARSPSSPDTTRTTAESSPTH